MNIDKPARRRRKEARPQEIIAAAFQEFDEKGFGRSTFAGIARRAGISRTTIYLYYDSKEALFEAAVRATVEKSIDEVAEMAGNSEEDFAVLFESAIKLIYTRLVNGEAGVILKVLVAEGRLMPELVSFYRREILSKGENVIKALVTLGIKRGQLSENCRDIDVRILVAPAIFAALWLRVFDQVDPMDVDAFRDAHVRVILDGLINRSIP